jgi:hypothetical protein
MDSAPGTPGNERGWSPQTSTSTAYANTPSPNVTISDAAGVVPGLPIATRPTTSPTAAPTTTASPSAATCGTPEASRLDADSAAMTANAPCAKLTTCVTR